MSKFTKEDEPKIPLTIEEQANLVAIHQLHKKGLSKFETKQLITDEMRLVARKIGAPEIVFEKPELQEIDINDDRKSEIARHASKFKSERKTYDKPREKRRICKQCGNKSSLCCGRCGKAWYCSKECQVLHWKNVHKVKCTGQAPPKPAVAVTTTSPSTLPHNTATNTVES